MPIYTLNLSPTVLLEPTHPAGSAHRWTTWIVRRSGIIVVASYEDEVNLLSYTTPNLIEKVVYEVEVRLGNEMGFESDPVFFTLTDMVASPPGPLPNARPILRELIELRLGPLDSQQDLASAARELESRLNDVIKYIKDELLSND